MIVYFAVLLGHKELRYNKKEARKWERVRTQLCLLLKMADVLSSIKQLLNTK